MQLGLSSYTYTWAVGVPGSMPLKPLSPEDLVDKAVAAGLGLVQIADNLPLEKMSEKELIDLEKYSSGKGVEIEMGGRGLTPEHTIQCLETAKSLNSPIPQPSSLLSENTGMANPAPLHNSRGKSNLSSLITK